MDPDTAPTSTSAYFAMWQNGELSAPEALRILADDLRSLEDAMSVLMLQRNTLYRQVVTVLEAIGGTADIPGIGQVTVTTSHANYDSIALDMVIASLVTTHPDIASQLAACRKGTPERTIARVTTTQFTI